MNPGVNKISSGHTLGQWLACLILGTQLCSSCWADNRPLATSSKQIQPKWKIGKACQRRTDTLEGIVKQDACGRLYCGRKDIKDITQLIPDADKRMNCSWQLQGVRCMCIKNTPLIK